VGLGRPCYRQATPEEIAAIEDRTFKGSYRRAADDIRVGCTPPGSEKARFKTSDRLSFLEWLEDTYGAAVVSPGEKPDIANDAKYGYARVDGDGNVLQVIRRTNPNSRWDGWALGGRWPDMLVVKMNAPHERGRSLGRARSEPDPELEEDGRIACDAAPAGQIDWEYMHLLERRKAERTWDADQERLREQERKLLADGQTWESLMAADSSDVRDRFEGACRAYGLTPDVDVYRRWRLSCTGFFWILGVNLMKCPTKEKLVAAQEVPVTYAVVKDGEWHTKSAGGLFDQDADAACRDWQERFQELLEDVPPDWMIAVVDCHY